MKNIMLIGFMGSGKTTVSKELSQILNLTEIDTDKLIETREKMKISEIFEKKGEPYFRNCETSMLKELSQEDNILLSCGGGMALPKENRKLMKSQGQVVLLTAEPETVLERLKDSTDRPILNKNMNISYIESLMNKRYPFYEDAADIMVATDGKTIEEICQEIIKKLINS